MGRLLFYSANRNDSYLGDVSVKLKLPFVGELIRSASSFSMQINPSLIKDSEFGLASGIKTHVKRSKVLIRMIELFIGSLGKP